MPTETESPDTFEPFSQQVARRIKYLEDQIAAGGTLAATIILNIRRGSITSADNAALLQLAQNVLSDHSAQGLTLNAPPPTSTDPWIPVTETSLPPFNIPVWLKLPDGSRILGERVNEPEGWLWARCYSPPWFDQDTQTWEGQNSEEDDDYQPTHYALLPA